MEERATKAALRAARLGARDALSAGEREQKSALICRHALSGLAVGPGAVVSGYCAIRSEVDIGALMTELARQGARLCLPAVLDRETIVFRAWTPDEPLADAGWGTKGPPADAPLAEPEILLMPLSAFDARGNRIGYGAGHYDRAIDRLRQKGLNPRLIGIAFACQEVAEVPAGPHDVAMDGIVTENGIFFFG